jgi:hypothetical protein
MWGIDEVLGTTECIFGGSGIDEGIDMGRVKTNLHLTHQILTINCTVKDT